MCLSRKPETGSEYGDKCKFLHTEAGGGGAKGWFGGFERDYSIGACVCPLIPFSENRFCGKMDSWDRICQAFEGHDASRKKS